MAGDVDGVGGDGVLNLWDSIIGLLVQIELQCGRVDIDAK